VLAPELLDTGTRRLALTEDSNDTRSATGLGKSAAQFFPKELWGHRLQNAPCWGCTESQFSPRATGKHMIGSPYAPYAYVGSRRNT
jgi:hypothetical protein